jgi:hypothetical protein
MTPQLIIAGVIALGSFGTAWRIQDWRYQAKEVEHAEQQLADERSAATAAIRRAEAVIEAQSAAAVRERGLRNDAAGARSAAERLSDEIAATTRAAATSQEACLERTNTLGELFKDSANAYRDVAEKADRHASDAQRLSDSWPQ